MKSNIEWANQEHGYNDAITGHYHKQRLEFILKMIPKNVEMVLDFGGGEGVVAREIVKRGIAKYVKLIDPSENLINSARQAEKFSEIKIEKGDVTALGACKNQQFDLILSINVMAYLTTEEESEFYHQALRILKPEGILVITHSNELFDMFTMNNLTVEFFKKNFKVDIKNFLKLEDTPEISTYSIRENPLNYAIKMKTFGFTEIKQEFFHFHPVLPRQIANNSRNILFEEEKCNIVSDWKNQFQSSTFGSVLKKFRTQNEKIL